MTDTEQTRCQELEAEIEAAKDRIDALRDQVGRLTRDRDDWEGNATDAQGDLLTLATAKGMADKAHAAIKNGGYSYFSEYLHYCKALVDLLASERNR